MFNVALPWKKLSLRLIQGLRNTGLFNNDWDTVYGITLFVSCSLPEPYRSVFPLDSAEGRARAERLTGPEAGGVFSKAQRLVGRLARSSASAKTESAPEAVWNSVPEDRMALCEQVKELLGYPGNPPSSLLASLFDEVYHGGPLYREMYGVEPRYNAGVGFIERDKVIVRRSDLGSLAAASHGRLAMLTGRPRKAAEYSLGRLISYFRLGASVFIGDGDVRPTPEAASFRKPSGKSLLWAREKLHSRRLVYVGDSAEDLQMVKNARKSADGLAFAGVYANSYEPSEQLRFFRREGAELILPSVREMPRVMREVARG